MDAAPTYGGGPKGSVDSFTHTQYAAGLRNSAHASRIFTYFKHYVPLSLKVVNFRISIQQNNKLGKCPKRTHQYISSSPHPIFPILENRQTAFSPQCHAELPGAGVEGYEGLLESFQGDRHECGTS